MELKQSLKKKYPDSSAQNIYYHHSCIIDVTKHLTYNSNYFSDESVASVRIEGEPTVEHDKSAMELAIEVLINKIDNMERDMEILVKQLEQEKRENQVQDETKNEIIKLNRKIKLDRQKTIRLVRQSMQEREQKIEDQYFIENQ